MRHTSLKVLGGLVRRLRMSRGRRRFNSDQSFGLGCILSGTIVAGVASAAGSIALLAVGTALVLLGGYLLLKGTVRRSRRHFRHRGRRG